MIPFLLSLMCITGLHQKSQCPTQTPISNHKLHEIWDPTSPYQYLSQHTDQSYYTSNKKPVDMKALVGKMVRIAAIVDPPYVEEIFENNKTLSGNARMAIDVLRQALGFDWQIVRPKENVIGAYNEATGKWNGIMGLLMDGEADFSIQFISMLPERVHAVNFSKPFGEERWVVMMKRPQETTDGDGLMAPFQTEVWWYLLISLLAMGPLAYIMVRLRCYACRGVPGLNEPYSFGHSIWFVYGALMKQGSVLKPVADSTRILFATWWIFVTILTAFYTANLTAYLTLSKIPIPYDGLHKISYRKYWVTTLHDTIQEVVNSKGTPNNTAGNIYYKEAVPYPEFINLRWSISNGRRYGNFMSNLTDMIERVRRKNDVLLEEQSKVERIIYTDFRDMSRKHTPLHKRCNFIMSRVPILRVSYGFAFSPKSNVQPIFEPILDKLTKSGLFNYWRRWKLPVKDPCNANSDFRERQLRNGDLMTTYIICGTGYGMGFVSFLIEIIHRFFSNRKLKTQLVPMPKTDNLSFYKGNLTVPAGAPTFFDTEKFLKNINGRDYLVMKTADGRTRLVPKNDGLQALQPVYNPTPPINYSYMS